MKYYIVTFGCQMNDRDSEVIAGIMESMGYSQAASVENCDICIVNTCCVRQTAENKAFSLLGKLRQHKKSNQDLIIGIGGCMSQRKGVSERIKRLFPHVDLIFGTHNLHRLPEMISDIKNGNSPVIEVWEKPLDIVEGSPIKRKNKVRALVTIMHGCNNYCNYCVVPYVRGGERSREPGKILEELKQLSIGGYKEAVLLGQNVNSYGRDLNPAITFAGLLKLIDKSVQIGRIRYMTSHPKDFNRDLILTVAELKQVCENFHLPVQSGSDRILKLMNRGYTRDQYIELIHQIRSIIPNASISTDIMVGFPGETEQDFIDTLNIVKEARFDNSYTFIYNDRPGTPANDMAEKVSLTLKKERIQRLIKLQNTISDEKNCLEEGRIHEVLVEGIKDNSNLTYYGRNRGNKLVYFTGVEGLIGKTVSVHIKKTGISYLSGIMLY